MATPAPAPGSPSPIAQDIIQQIQSRLTDREKIYQTVMKDLSVQLGAMGVQGAKAIKDLAEGMLAEGLRQAKEYEEEIVDVYGDISTQQEKFGKSAAKLSYERTLELRQEFLQMEEGGVKLIDVFEDAEKAAAHANEIIGNFQGSAIQFTDELQKQNLTVIQLLSKASGLAEEQTAAIMKIAKGRGEDSKQMLADIGTFSKTLADKFGLDTKRVSRNVVEITRNTSTFGKVSVEAATAAAVKFESLGVEISDVADSIGSTFGSFSGAADAAAKLSQVFGVNIDAMQMMVDVNSGPEGMVSALDNLRESLIGAGVDASELSAPMRRLIKDMTGVRDDATIESLFDPDRIGVETDEIIDSAKKAAESQKEPLDAIKFLDQDIAKVRRGIGELDDLVKKQNLARLGTSATEAAKGFSKLSADSAQFFDNANLLLQRTENVDKGMKTVLKTSEAVTSAGSLSAQAGSQMLRNEAAKQGFQLSEARGPEYGIMQEAGRGVFQDKAYQEQTGYTPPEEALKKAAIQVAGQKFKDTGLKALGEYANNGAVSPQTKSDLSTAETAYRDAYKATGLDPTQAINEVYGMSTATSQAQGALGQQGVQPSLATILTGQTVAAVAPAPAAAPVTAATPVSAIPAAPAASPATAAPAAATPAAAVPAAPVSAAPAQMTTAPVVARTSAGAVNVGTATTSSGTPVNINLSVTLDAGAMTKVLASQGVAMVGP